MLTFCVYFIFKRSGRRDPYSVLAYLCTQDCKVKCVAGKECGGDDLADDESGMNSEHDASCTYFCFSWYSVKDCVQVGFSSSTVTGGSSGTFTCT